MYNLRTMHINNYTIKFTVSFDLFVELGKETTNKNIDICG